MQTPIPTNNQSSSLLPKSQVQMIRRPHVLVLRLRIRINAGARNRRSLACVPSETRQ